MNEYLIVFKKSVGKDLKKIQKNDQTRILNAIKELGINPRPSGFKQLQGMRDLFRIRVGDYRIIYQIVNEEITIIIVRVGHRKSVY